MQSLMQKVQQYIVAHLKEKRYRRLVTGLASLVVFCTTYALILPAITMTADTYCGFEEHSHTDECYEEELVCTNENEDHEHTSSCYKKTLICGMKAHKHTKSCYKDHSDEAESEEIWEETLPKNMGEVYTRNVATVAKSQVGYLENKEYHQVDEDYNIHSYTRYGEWYGNPFGDWDAMFASFCLHYAGVPEDTLSYGDNPADWAEELEELGYYQAKDYATPRTGDLIFFDTDTDGETDHVGIIADVAYKKNGNVKITTVEGQVNNGVRTRTYSGDSETIVGYGILPEYCDCYDADGTRFCEEDCDCECHLVDENGIYLTATASDAEKASNSDAIEKASDSDAKKCGCYDEDGNRVCEEDCDCECHKETTCSCYDTDGNRLCGEDCTCDCHKKQEILPTAKSLSYEGEDYRVTIRWTDSNALPENTKLVANDYDPDSEEHENYYEKTLAQLVEEGYWPEHTDLPLARFADLSLYNGEEKIEPEGTVSVTVTYKDNYLENLAGLALIHFKEDGTTEILDVDARLDSEKQTIVSYEMDSFSVVGLFGVTGAAINQLNYTEVTGSGKVNVSLTWGADTDSVKKDIVVTLYKDGVSTGKTVTLNNGNNYTASFDNLDEGTYTIQYDTEIANGYVCNETATSVSGETWDKADSLQSGNTYVLVYNNGSVVMNNNGSLAAGSVTVSGDTITGVTEGMEWEYNGSTLKNVEAQEYLRLGRYSSSYYYYYLDFSNGAAISYGQNNKKISATLYSRTRYLQEYSTAVSNQNSATSYTLYKKTSSASSMDFTIQVNKVASAEDVSFEHSKTIDYLGDGVTNPDTTVTGKDAYRLYLDMTGKREPMDLLVVVDASGSMSKTDMTIGNSSSQKRSAAVTNFLYGSTSATTEDGFLSRFLSMNSENQVSIVKFYGNTSYNGSNSKISRQRLDYQTDSSVLLDWTSSATFESCAEESNNGTDYEAGLKRATNQFSKVNRDGHKKIMLFLSDGVPTYFLIDSNDIGKTNGYPSGLTQSNVGYRWGDGFYDSADNYANCKEPSKTAFDDFISSNPNVTVFTVGVSSDISATSESESQSPEVLQYMAENGGGEFLSAEDSMDALKDALLEKFFPKGVRITDTLSQYVRYNSTTPDVKVTMTKISDGTETVLYENGASTGQTDSYGNKIFETVTYTAGDTSDSPSASTGTIIAQFGTEYCFDPAYRYTLSFNVNATQTAYDTAAGNKAKAAADGNKDVSAVTDLETYGNVSGDAGTDYGTNTTSSNKPGFHSNDTAYVDYIVSGSSYQETYDHPVVQVSGDDPETPTDPSAPHFEHKKTIDSLNDSVANPDTDLSGKDYYRLYLDMTGKQEPIDLLIVVDGSGSMVLNSDVDSMRRDDAITKFLNGSVNTSTHTGTSTDSGFIPYFLSMNKNNRVSVIQFAGDATKNGDYSTSRGNTSWGSPGNSNISKDSWNLENDCSVLLTWDQGDSWSTGISKVDCIGKESNGTNYEAGLKLATTQFKEVQNDGHRKYMIFLSDGVPTYFIVDQNDVGKKDAYSSYDSQNSYIKENDLTDDNVGKRYGHGMSSEFSDMVEATKQAFRDFLDANQEVKVYTVGVSNDINSESTGTDSKSPVVLKYMAETGGGDFISVTDNTNGLKQKLQSILFPCNVTITDTLSKYVRYYDAQPDVKVTMTNSETGQIIVLYENGTNKQVTRTDNASGNQVAVLDEENPIIYTPLDTTGADTSDTSDDTPTSSTGTVQAVFNSAYCFEPGWTYTLSFNVKATQTAYNEYRTSGYKYLKDNGSGREVVGDSNTDYSYTDGSGSTIINMTSSEKPGFHSNTQATVSYKVDGNDYSEDYDHPVIQAEAITTYELPETGGMALWYTMGGLFLMGSSLLCGLCLRRKRERRFS